MTTVQDHTGTSLNPAKASTAYKTTMKECFVQSWIEASLKPRSLRSEKYPSYLLKKSSAKNIPMSTQLASGAQALLAFSTKSGKGQGKQFPNESLLKEDSEDSKEDSKDSKEDSKRAAKRGICYNSKSGDKMQPCLPGMDDLHP